MPSSFSLFGAPLWLFALSPSARAFAPVDVDPQAAGAGDTAVPIGLEPQRLFVTHDAEQGRLLAGAPWRRFAADVGGGWNARFDESTGTPRYLWGRGLQLGGDDPSIDASLRALIALIESHGELFGVAPGTVRVRSANHVARVDTWYVDLDTLRSADGGAGLPTWRGGVSARIKHGNLIALTVGTAPRAEVTGSLTISAGEAVQRAISAGPQPLAIHTDPSAEPILLERRSLDGFELRTAWLVRTFTDDPPGRWVSFVDAETGALLSVHDEVRYANGTITGMHHRRTIDGTPLVEDPMPYIRVSQGASSTFADDLGDYTLNGNGNYETVLEGEYLEVRNSAGPEGDLGGNNPDLTWDNGDATQAEIDSYVFIHQVKAWGDRTAPEVAWVQGPVVSNVNINQSCNAYWDGELNFFSSGGGCNNTGQIADVNYHEWGHGFHYYSIQSGVFDSSLSEGVSDVVSFLQTHDHIMAPGFGTSGWAIRDVAPDKRYPQDYVNNPYYSHENGLIIGGAFWDLLDLLTAEEGLDAGTASTSHILAGTLKGGTDIPGAFYEALVADDDDGDLDNGSPHVCELYDAFSRHNLASSQGIDAVLVSHDPLDNVPADQDAEIDVELVAVSAGCQPVGARSAKVHYRIDGGAWTEASLSGGGSAISGSIPGQPADTFVEYYIDGTSDGGDPFTTPAGGLGNPYSYYVGDSLILRCDTFDDDDGGYTHELVSGEVGDGADDWQWGVPAGQSGDPVGAYSGTKVWGNDLGFDGFNGAYQPDKVNRLSAPKLDTKHYTGVFLQYRRWLRVQDGGFDQAKIEVNGAEVWANFDGSSSTANTLDASWVSHSVPLGGLADQGSIQLRFELDTNGSQEFGGWTLDDVCVLAPATPDNRLGITDFTVEATSDTVATLSWTNPIHRPVERVRVVRRLDRMPTGWDDGDLAEEIADPEPGERVEVDDVNGHHGETFYAVYAFDGVDWLSWTVEGWNADEVTLEGGEVPTADQWDTGLPGEDPGGRVGGCTCASAAVGPRSWAGSALGWLAVAGLAVRRRRTR